MVWHAPLAASGALEGMDAGMRVKASPGPSLGSLAATATAVRTASAGAEPRREGSVVASIDCKRKWQGGWRVLTCHGREKTAWEPEAWAVELEKRGAGEIMLTTIDQDGTFKGYDVELTRTVVNAVDLPVIACGGAGNLEHVNQALNDGGAMAAGAGSLFVFQGSNRSVLVNYPGRGKLDALLK